MECVSCGDPIDVDEYVKAIRQGKIKQAPKHLTHCRECFEELAGIDIPNVVGPYLPAPHTGLVDRQRAKLHD